MNNNRNSENIESDDFIEEFIKNLDISIAELEKAGAILLTIGYSHFFYGAEIDILESLEINTTGKSPDDITLFGQQLVLAGYIILWTVAVKRVKEKIFINEKTNRNFPITPYIQVADTYLLSVFSNAIRLDGFVQIASSENNGEFIE